MLPPNATSDGAAAAVSATELARREERAISWVRLVGGLLMAWASLLFAAPLPEGGRWLVQLVCLVAALTGAAGLRVLTPGISARRLLRLRLWTLASDATITLLFTALYVRQPMLAVFVLTLPVQGAMKLGAPGALAMTAVGASSGVTSQLLRTLITDHAFDPSLAWAPVLPGVGIGLMAAVLASTRTVETLQQLRLARDLDGRRDAGRVAHAVLESGLAAPHAADALLRSASERTGVPLLVLLSTGENVHEAVEVAAVLADGAERTDDVVIEERGPVRRALQTRRPVYSPPTEVASRSLRGATSSLIVPVLVDGDVVAILVAETDRGAIPGAAAEDLQQTADHLALVFGLQLVRGHRETLEREIAQLENARDQVLAIGSHELRTPLTSVIGFSEVLWTNGERLAPHEVVQFGRIMHGAASRLMRTLRDVQIADSLRRGSLWVSPSTFELGTLVSTVVSEWPGTTVHTGARVRVHADATHVRTVLERLVDNAWQHGNGRDVEVGWTQVGDEIVLWVQDEGPGVPERVREHLTAPFVQAEDVLSHSRGTGLGLSIADGLCHSMAARLVLAEPGPGGTRFEVWLPTGAHPRSDRAGFNDRRTPDRTATSATEPLH